VVLQVGQAAGWQVRVHPLKQGEATSHTYAVKNTYYKLSVNDRPLWEIDLLNHIYRKDGKDIVPDRIRSALGLG
ncbi:phage major tail tube protein, partial [Pseudomonas aeruginosa]|uniref:phage major tail tube protein n=1 Tax=Pseudomonas aeruginosa TaxID=287 RepID=UPI0031B69BF0